MQGNYFRALLWVSSRFLEYFKLLPSQSRAPDLLPESTARTPAALRPPLHGRHGDTHLPLLPMRLQAVGSCLNPLSLFGKDLCFCKLEAFTVFVTYQMSLQTIKCDFGWPPAPTPTWELAFHRKLN